MNKTLLLPSTEYLKNIIIENLEESKKKIKKKRSFIVHTHINTYTLLYLVENKN